MNSTRRDSPPRSGLASGASITPVSTDTPQKGKYILSRVIMLDDTEGMFKVPQKALGKVLFEQVCKNLNLLESDYFGLEYTDLIGNHCWLDLEKPFWRQIGGLPAIKFFFVVKFYTPDPGQLEEEYTRYLFALQIKRDLVTGAMPCNDATAALLASYIVQAECGDYVEEDYPDHSYLTSYKFVPHQCDDLEKQIMSNHKKHVGLSPADADYMLLDVARKVELYGVKIHTAKDHEGVALNLAVAHMGLHVFQNFTKINTFSWAKIRKLSFKRKRFLIKLHPEGYGYYKDTVEFYFDDRNQCKNFWKKCVEHHAFFRCATVCHIPRKKKTLLSKGSQFRYSGRTMKEMVDDVRDSYVKRPPFSRTLSNRTSRSLVHLGAISTSVPQINSAVSEPRMMRRGSDTSGSHHLMMSDVTTPRSERNEFTSVSSREVTPAMTPSTPPPPPRIEMLPPQKLPEGKVSPPVPIQQEYERVSSPETPAALPCTEAVAAVIEEVPRSRQESSPPPPSSPKPYVPSRPEIPHIPPPDTPPPITDEEPAPEEDQKQPEPQQEEQQKEIPHIVPQEPPAVPVKRKAYPHDKSYYMCKELLSTERTYRTDLEVITVLTRKQLSSFDDPASDIITRLLSLLEPIYGVHCVVMKELEQRLASWEGRPGSQMKGLPQNKIGDILLEKLDLNVYQEYLNNLNDLLIGIEEACKKSKALDKFCRDFETKKECYLPINMFMVKPVQRLLHYKLIMESMANYYGAEHVDTDDLQAALVKVTEVLDSRLDYRLRCENLIKLIEIQRDLGGIDSIVDPRREFVREGCLQKFSKKGYQQRMFFLFSDMLIYANRTSQPYLQFKVHGQLPVKGMIVEETPESKMAVPHCFALYNGSRMINIAANSEEEKYKWIEDINRTITKMKERDEKEGTGMKPPALKLLSDSTDETDGAARTDDTVEAREKSFQQRGNTSTHVCWHRNTSVGIRDYNRAVTNQLSGYLLRKFKNSNGWQKLWVVFTNFCLFFYKTFNDDAPLASLPVLGYTVSTPEPSDGIQKDLVFKLQFKNHVYFFRAESEYLFTRWMEVVSSATHTSTHTRLFSRMDSYFDTDY